MLDSDLLIPGRILAGVVINSKKRLFELISETLARKNVELSSRDIFESLCAREQLGSTALGNGVAIPHGRVSNTDGAEVLFLQLAKPLPFGDHNAMPVDLIYALAIPMQCTEEHSELLRSIADRFSDPRLIEQLRKAQDTNELWQLLSNS